MLVESLLLSSAGGALGIALAWWGVRGLVAIAPASAPRLQDVSLDLPVLAFTGGRTMLAAVLCGLAPIVGSGRRQTGTRRRRRDESAVQDLASGDRRRGAGAPRPRIM